MSADADTAAGAIGALPARSPPRKSFKRWSYWGLSSLFKAKEKELGSEPWFDPEGGTAAKRQWLEARSSLSCGRAVRLPGRLFEGFYIVGAPLDADAAALQRQLEELERARGEGAAQAGAGRGDAVAPAELVLDPVVLYRYPEGTGKTPLADAELAALCFASGVAPSLLRPGGGCAGWRDAGRGGDGGGGGGGDRGQAWFVFRLKAADDIPLYGACWHVPEPLRPPPLLARAAAPGGAPAGGARGAACGVAAPRCYCLLSHYPFFDLHYRVMRMVLDVERLQQAAELDAAPTAAAAAAASPAFAPAAKRAEAAAPAARAGAAAAGWPGRKAAAAPQQQQQESGGAEALEVMRRFQQRKARALAEAGARAKAEAEAPAGAEIQPAEDSEKPEAQQAQARTQPQAQTQPPASPLPAAEWRARALRAAAPAQQQQQQDAGAAEALEVMRRFQERKARALAEAEARARAEAEARLSDQADGGDLKQGRDQGHTPDQARAHGQAAASGGGTERSERAQGRAGLVGSLVRAWQVGRTPAAPAALKPAAPAAVKPAPATQQQQQQPREREREGRVWLQLSASEFSGRVGVSATAAEPPDRGATEQQPQLAHERQGPGDLAPAGESDAPVSVAARIAAMRAAANVAAEAQTRASPWRPLPPARVGPSTPRPSTPPAPAGPSPAAAPAAAPAAEPRGPAAGALNSGRVADALDKQAPPSQVHEAARQGEAVAPALPPAGRRVSSIVAARIAEAESRARAAPQWPPPQRAASWRQPAGGSPAPRGSGRSSSGSSGGIAGDDDAAAREAPSEPPAAAQDQPAQHAQRVQAKGEPQPQAKEAAPAAAERSWLPQLLPRLSLLRRAPSPEAEPAGPKPAGPAAPPAPDHEPGPPTPDAPPAARVLVLEPPRLLPSLRDGGGTGSDGSDGGGCGGVRVVSFRLTSRVIETWGDLERAALGEERRRTYCAACAAAVGQLLPSAPSGGAPAGGRAAGAPPPRACRLCCTPLSQAGAGAAAAGGGPAASRAAPGILPAPAALPAQFGIIRRNTTAAAARASWLARGGASAPAPAPAPAGRGPAARAARAAAYIRQQCADLPPAAVDALSHAAAAGARPILEAYAAVPVPDLGTSCRVEACGGLFSAAFTRAVPWRMPRGGAAAGGAGWGAGASEAGGAGPVEDGAAEEDDQEGWEAWAAEAPGVAGVTRAPAGADEGAGAAAAVGRWLPLRSDDDAIALADMECAEQLQVAALAALCRALSLDNLVTLLTAALLERQIVLLSPDLGELSSCALALPPLLRPFVWQSVLLTVTPARMRALLDAPVPFVLGLQRRLPELSTRCDEVIIVDLREGQITLQGGPPDLPELPGAAALARRLARHHSTLAAAAPLARGRPPHVVTAHEAAAAAALAAAARDHLCGLLGDLRPHIIVNVGMRKRTGLLLKDAAVESRPPAERAFAAAFVETQMFAVWSDAVVAAFCEAE